MIEETSAANDNKEGEIAPRASSAGFTVKSTGFPGEPYSFVLTNVFKEPDAHLNKIPPSGIPGLYKVTFILGKPGSRNFPENEIKFAEFSQGDSHLAILAPAFPAPPDAVNIRLEVGVNDEHFVFTGFANDRGYLAKLESSPFHAKHRNDAEFRATQMVQGILSEYSAKLDIPLQIDLTQVTEVSPSNISLTLIAPFIGGGSSAPILHNLRSRIRNRSGVISRSARL